MIPSLELAHLPHVHRVHMNLTLLINSVLNVIMNASLALREQEQIVSHVIQGMLTISIIGGFQKHAQTPALKAASFPI